MAVIQISRIQVRRGQKNAGSGIPQLASGELGWAVDSRELFIGNGAVSDQCYEYIDGDWALFGTMAVSRRRAAGVTLADGTKVSPQIHY